MPSRHFAGMDENPIFRNEPTMRFRLCAGTWTCRRVILGTYGTWRAARIDFDAMTAALRAAGREASPGGLPGVSFSGDGTDQIGLWIDRARPRSFADARLAWSTTRMTQQEWKFVRNPLGDIEAMRETVRALTDTLSTYEFMTRHLSRVAMPMGWHRPGDAPDVAGMMAPGELSPRDALIVELRAAAAPAHRLRSLMGRVPKDSELVLRWSRRIARTHRRMAFTDPTSSAVAAAIDILAAGEAWRGERNEMASSEYVYGESRTTPGRTTPRRIDDPTSPALPRQPSPGDGPVGGHV